MSVHYLQINFKLEKGQTDKAKEQDPGGSDQQNLGFKILKNRKTDRTVWIELLYYLIFRQARPDFFRE